MFFVPTLAPIMKAATTNTSQPKTAVFQWLALQRPMRAAMLFERLRGDISLLLRGLGVREEGRPAESWAKWGVLASCGSWKPHRCRTCESRQRGGFHAGGG